MCEIYKEELGLCVVDDGGYKNYDNKKATLPGKVTKEFNMDYCGQYENTYLASNNDSGRTFAEIADIIEQNKYSIFKVQK